MCWYVMKLLISSLTSFSENLDVDFRAFQRSLIFCHAWSMQSYAEEYMGSQHGEIQSFNNQANIIHGI